MRYSRAIIFFLTLSIFIIILLLYFANITRQIEKENHSLIKHIDTIKDQININEVEFSLYNGYDYLFKLQSIYLKKNNQKNINNRINFQDLLIKETSNFHTVGTRQD